jgi:hypothetical protein
MPSLSFGIVGLALIPFIFFYISKNINEQFKSLIIFFFSLGLFGVFLTIATIMQDMNPTLADSFAWLNYSIMALFILYIMFEIINISFTFLMSTINGLRGKR